MAKSEKKTPEKSVSVASIGSGAKKKSSEKSVPVSSFGSGAKKGKKLNLGKSKDTRYLLEMVGVLAGVLLLWFRKPNKEEEAFVGPYIRMLMDKPDKMEELGIAAIIRRKGADGTTEKPQKAGSTWGWSQLLVVIGEDKNTPEERERVASAILDDFNAHCTRAMFDYPNRARFARDYTAAIMEPADAHILDKDVLGLMKSAYETPLEDLKFHVEVMEKFWSNVEEGGEKIDEFVANFGSGLNSKEDLE